MANVITAQEIKQLKHGRTVTIISARFPGHTAEISSQGDKNIVHLGYSFYFKKYKNYRINMQQCVIFTIQCE